MKKCWSRSTFLTARSSERLKSLMGQLLPMPLLTLRRRCRLMRRRPNGRAESEWLLSPRFHSMRGDIDHRRLLK